MKKIYYAMPSITQREVDYATDAAANGWGDKCYKYINRFEKSFADYLGVQYAIATSSCTGALHMGYAALGIGPGDEVILCDTNWIAAASAITYLGATPILIDVLKDSWCMDPDKIEDAITPRTKAIVATHIYGNLCDMDAIMKIGKKHNIPVIEDAAEALGSEYHGKKAGSIGIFGVFSFHGTKTLTTGEGGMFVTNDKELYDKVATLAGHGRNKNEKRQFWSELIGFKYKMSNVQAAIGCAQIERIEELVNKKRLIFKWYEEKLKNYPVKLNPEPENCINSYWMVTIIVDKNINFDREKLLQEFKNNDIDGRVFFWPLSMMGHDKFQKHGDNPVSYDLYRRGMNLPCYHDVTEENVDRVITCIKKVMDWK